MSLNHQKRVAERCFGSYDILDALRKNARRCSLSAKVRQDRTKQGSKADLQAKVKEIEHERVLLLQDLFILQRAYDLRCLQARTYAQAADTATQTRCLKEQRELDASFSLRLKPIPASNVSYLPGAHKNAHNR